MRDFLYLEPATLGVALSMLADHGDEACVFAGGTALLLGMRARMMAPEVLVSLGQLSDLREIAFSSSNGLTIGALARHSDVARSEAVLANYPMLAGMAANLANPQVRNQGTIGGNLCYADPATDPPACLIAMDAEVSIVGHGGERRISMREFSVDFFTTALEAGEILTAIHLPPPSGRLEVYRRHLRTPAEHRPVANIALTFSEQKGVCADVRLVIGAATPSPQSMTLAEQFLNGRAMSLDVAAEAADLVAAELNPISDGRGEGEFRRRIVRAATRRAIAEAAGLEWKEFAA